MTSNRLQRIVGFVLLTVAPSFSLFGDTTNLIPVADTSLHDTFPDNNFGSGTTFTSGGLGSSHLGGRSRALLRFDIAGKIPAGSTINSVSLVVQVSNAIGPDSTFDLKRLINSWGEGSGSDFMQGTAGGAGEATWNNRLGPGTSWTSAGGDFLSFASASQAVGGSGSVNTFTSSGLVTDVQLWLDSPGTNFGWCLQSQAEATSGTIRRFTGRLDGANPPRLTITYSPATGPAIPPDLFNISQTANQFRFSFNGRAGRTYAVEGRSALDTAWATLTNIPVLSADAVVDFTNVITGDQKYFRARTP